MIYVAIAKGVPAKMEENAKNLSMDASNVNASEDSLESSVKSTLTDAKESTAKMEGDAKLLATPSSVNARKDTLESTVKSALTDAKENKQLMNIF